MSIDVNKTSYCELNKKQFLESLNKRDMIGRMRSASCWIFLSLR